MFSGILQKERAVYKFTSIRVLETVSGPLASIYPKRKSLIGYPGGVLIGEVDKYHELGKWGFNVNYNGWHGARSMSKELLELIVYEMNMLDE